MEAHERSPYFNQIKDRLVLRDMAKEKVSAFVIKERNDIAYIFDASRIRELMAAKFTSYRQLPEVVFVKTTFPVRMTKPTPYEDLFTIAIMRSMAAGAMDKVCRDHNERIYSILRKSPNVAEEESPMPLSLRSLGAIFAVWSSGCVLAFFVFILESCVKKVVQLSATETLESSDL